jgi:hypothetical protein
MVLASGLGFSCAAAGAIAAKLAAAAIKKRMSKWDRIRLQRATKALYRRNMSRIVDYTRPPFAPGHPTEIPQMFRPLSNSNLEGRILACQQQDLVFGGEQLDLQP